MLESIIGEGESPKEDSARSPDFEASAREILQLVRPLSVLVANKAQEQGASKLEGFPALQRDAWFNIVVHDSFINPTIAQRRRRELALLARSCPPLIAEERFEKLESDIELNTVLRRRKDSHAGINQKKDLIELLPSCEPDIRDLSYPEAVFIKSAFLVETLRAAGGDCTKVFTYFYDSKLHNTSMGKCMAAVASEAINRMLQNTVGSRREWFSAPFLSHQLSKIFEFCCHRVDTVQDTAFRSAERIITVTPSVLCQRFSLFALLDTLSVMWSSCLDFEMDEYDWTSQYPSPVDESYIQVSDDIIKRKYALKRLHKSVVGWISRALNNAPLDVKGLLQVSVHIHGPSLVEKAAIRY